MIFTINRFIAYSVVIALFAGCGAQNKQVVSDFTIPTYIDEEEDEQEILNNGIYIHGVRGAYPLSYKDKELGDGLFNHKFFNISQKIIDRLDENIEREILIKIITKNKKSEVKEVVDEGIKYFKLHNDFVVWSKNNTNIPDVILKIEEDNSIKFIVSYHSEIFSRGKDDREDLGLSINEISSESKKPWSTVIVHDRDDNIVKYQIMKNSVSVSQYNKSKIGNKPVTNIKYSDADQYCTDKYNGYVSPLYVFEYALRQGAIVPPKYGVNKEMIAGYDDGNEEDKVLKREGDIVKSDMTISDDAYAEIVIFDYKTKRYNFKRDNFISKSVTFRCVK
jgi:hypothetical protein